MWLRPTPSRRLCGLVPAPSAQSTDSEAGGLEFDPWGNSTAALFLPVWLLAANEAVPVHWEAAERSLAAAWSLNESRPTEQDDSSTF